VLYAIVCDCVFVLYCTVLHCSTLPPDINTFSANNNNNKHEQHTRKTRSQGTTENSHIEHCPHSSESINVKYNRFHTETNDISTMNSNNRIAATLCSLGT